VLQRYLARDIHYLAGGLDTATTTAQDEDLDVSCAAKAQGSSRLVRALNLYRLIDDWYPGHGDTFTLVPNVGHSGVGMYGSDQGRRTLFRW
jgi:hypothetical protein